MASYNGRNGSYSLGVNGKGMYVVKANNETYLFQSHLLLLKGIKSVFQINGT